jgi:hypothetical protein
MGITEITGMGITETGMGITEITGMEMGIMGITEMRMRMNLP